MILSHFVCIAATCHHTASWHSAYRENNAAFCRECIAACNASGFLATRRSFADHPLTSRPAGRTRLASWAATISGTFPAEPASAPLMRRDRLHDEIASESDISDRNIDFLIDRLRTKLGANAKSPTYIAEAIGMWDSGTIISARGAARVAF